MFNAEYYKNIRSNILEQLKKRYDWRGNEGFVLDGIISPWIFAQQKIRILVFLSETYGYGNCGEIIDLEKQIDQNYLGVGDPKKQTPMKIGSLVWLLTKCYENNGVKVPISEFYGHFKKSKELQESISKIAWINVKKTSRFDGLTTQVTNEIYEHAILNSDILKMQIDSIKPHLMIVCGDPVFKGLMATKLLGNTIDYSKNSITINEDGVHVIRLSAPRFVRDWGYDRIYKTSELILNKMLKNVG